MKPDAGVDERYERFRDAWEKLAEQLAATGVFGGGFDKPMSELVVATEGTVVRRFYAFTSMNRLSFACSPWPFERIQPVCVESWPGRPYRVCDGGPYDNESPARIALETESAEDAIAKVMTMLVGC